MLNDWNCKDDGGAKELFPFPVVQGSLSGLKRGIKGWVKIETKVS